MSSLSKEPEKAEKGYAHAAHSSDDDIHTSFEEARLMTRLGLTAESFQRRNAVNSHDQLNKTMRARHLHMIAIGGSIGAGFFVGSGSALRRGGPAALLIAFAIIGIVRRNVSMYTQY